MTNAKMEPPNHDAAVQLRVRTKRRARPEVKWNHGKQRDPKLQQRRPDTIKYGRRTGVPDSTEESPVPHSRPRKRRRRIVPESPLEALPPEVLQSIFIYSANVMLPLTSAQLASKLCNSSHLRHQLSDRLLEPVIRSATRASESDLAAANRLLNSRFMDFAFFKTWLLSRSRYGHQYTVSHSSSESSDLDWKALWAACQPSPRLLPPQKLFSPPFSDDKTAYLSVLALNIDDITSVSSPYGELAYEGLVAAVRAGRVELARVILGMGVLPTTELLRAAVMDADCPEHLVHKILRPHDLAVPARRVGNNNIDLLDPMLWSWAEQARTNGNPKGDWLIGVLRDFQEQQDGALEDAVTEFHSAI